MTDPILGWRIFATIMAILAALGAAAAVAIHQRTEDDDRT